MSDYEHGRLYLFTRGGETQQGVWDGRWFVLATGAVAEARHVKDVRPAIVLDPQDERVARLVEGWLRGEGFSLPDVAAVVDLIAAQITLPKPVMEKPTPAEVIRDHRLQPRIRHEGAAPATDFECLCTAFFKGVAEWSEHVSALLNPRAYEGVRDGE